MRFILWLCLGLGILWGGYWFVGAHVVEAQAQSWFADQKAAGLVAENSGLSVAGFADRFDLTVTEPHIADLVSGWGWQAPFAQVFAMTWKPWHLIAALPNTQMVALPDGQQITVGSSRMEASLLMQPAMGLPPERAIIDAEGLSVSSTAGWTAGAAKLLLAAENDPTHADTLRLGADATDIALPDTLARLSDPGAALALAHLDASVTFDTPIAWNMSASHVQAITLTALHVTWGELNLTATGTVMPDSSGLAQGKISIDLKGWRRLSAIVVGLGLVKPDMQVSIDRALEFLAKASPDPEVLSLPLSFEGGLMSLGPLPLGPSLRLQ